MACYSCADDVAVLMKMMTYCNHDLLNVEPKIC